MTVRLYQDIDGCLNVYASGQPWAESKDEDGLRGELSGTAFSFFDHSGDRTTGLVTKFAMKWNSRLIDALNELDVELVWTTTWRADAPGVGKLVGLSHRNRVLHPKNGKTTFPSIHWKYEALVAEQQESPSPFIWVDDEIIDLPRAAIETIHQLGGLYICPDPMFGMTPLHLERMREYIAQH